MSKPEGTSVHRHELTPGLLVLHGTPGDSLGKLASWAHWLSALALTPLVLRHAWRWTILKWRT